MTPNAIRTLADSLEREFMTAEDRKHWVSDLRKFAKDVERSVLLTAEWLHPNVPPQGSVTGCSP